MIEKNILNQETKICKVCGIEKPLQEFHKSPSNKDGRKTICRECLLDPKTKEKKRLLAIGFKKCGCCKEILSLERFGKSSKTKDGYRCYCKECKSKKNNPKGIVKKRKELAKQGLKKCSCCKQILSFFNFYLCKDGRYSACCKACSAIKRKNYRIINKEILNLKKRVFVKNKLDNDINFKLKLYLSHQIREKLKNKKNKKSFINFINYNIEDLKNHLELQFDKYMDWFNYGKKGWNIEHIIPQCLYNFVNKETGIINYDEIKKCWSLKNLRPLWEEENLKKFNKVDYDLILKYNLQFFMPERLLLEYKE